MWPLAYNKRKKGNDGNMRGWRKIGLGQKFRGEGVMMELNETHMKARGHSAKGSKWEEGGTP